MPAAASGYRTVNVVRSVVTLWIDAMQLKASAIVIILHDGNVKMNATMLRAKFPVVPDVTEWFLPFVHVSFVFHKHLIADCPSALARCFGTAFPICFTWSVLLPVNL